MTFHRSLNYGSAIQAWALSKTIQKLSEKEVEIIDYIPNHYEDIYALFWPPFTKSHVKYDLLHAAMLPFYLHRKWDFLQFWNKRIPLSKYTFNSYDSLKLYARNYSTIICGSDQIWNPRAIDFDMAYFLPGIEETKKIAYAVSMGDARLEEAPEQSNIKGLLENFHYLSMREGCAAKKIEEFMGNKRRVDVVLDPTLLMSINEYGDLISDREVNESYIFLYSVRLEKEVIDDAIKIGKRFNMPVYTLISGIGTYGILKKMGKLRLAKNDVGPSGFLSLLCNAEFVVTDSFHGTALSILFNKEFISINTIKYDGSLRNDARISSLLNLLSLNNRFIESNEIEAFDFQSKLDYIKVSNTLNIEVQKSIEFLKQALSE